MDSYCDRCHEDTDLGGELCYQCGQVLCDQCWGERANEICRECLEKESK